ncbi:hypothetical protein N7G274_001091 [Stereocaulon virgatum]|uniref:Uncharacterized protein n=1 Tax=Stereocaulon virgatum TaxID=373712 RepID=A0ABR4AQL7_9LECA
MSKPIGGILPPDSPNSKENSKPMLTPVHTLPTEPVPMQPLVDADLFVLGVDPRWIAANARYRRAKTFNRDDVSAAVLECQRVVAMMAKDAKETNAAQKPVRLETNDVFQPSDDVKSEDSWHPESIYSIPEEFKEQEGNNPKDRDVDPRSITANLQNWIARITGNPGDLDDAEPERKPAVAMVEEPVKTEMDRLSLSNDEESETPSRPKSVHASSTEFKKHQDDRLNYHEFKRLLKVLIDSQIVRLIIDPEVWKEHLQDCTAEEREELYLAFFELFLYSTSDKQKWYELLSDGTSARSGNLLRFICERVQQGIVGSHDKNAKDSGRRQTSSLASSDSAIGRDNRNAWDHRPYFYGCGAKGRASETEGDATESNDYGEFGGVRLNTSFEESDDSGDSDGVNFRTIFEKSGESEESDGANRHTIFEKSDKSGGSDGVEFGTIFENPDEDGYNASFSESPSEISSPASPSWSALPYALYLLPTDEPIEARRRSSSPARLRIPNTTRLFLTQQEDDDILRGRRSLRYSPKIPLAFRQLVGPLGTAVKKPQPENEAGKADESTITSEKPEDLSLRDTEDNTDNAGI